MSQTRFPRNARRPAPPAEEADAPPEGLDATPERLGKTAARLAGFDQGPANPIDGHVIAHIASILLFRTMTITNFRNRA